MREVIRLSAWVAESMVFVFQVEDHGDAGEVEAGVEQVGDAA